MIDYVCLCIISKEQEKMFDFLRRFGIQTAPVRYDAELKVYPSSFCFREEIDVGDKILLPSSALSRLSILMEQNSKSPLIFCLANMTLHNPKKTFCGVLEFVAQEGTCYIPNWMYKMLNFAQPGSPCQISLVRDMKSKGISTNFVKIRPHLTKFINLEDPKAVLQYQLRNFTCLHEGDTIQITTFAGKFEIDILQVKPKNDYQAICIINTDLEVDFAPPLDYEEPDYQPKNSHSKNSHSYIDHKNHNSGFSGNGTRIDGRKNNRNEQIIGRSQGQYDPRKHRIYRGVRKSKNSFTGSGVKIYEPNTKKPR